ncbi:MAG: hypothetical protein QOG99_2284 [Frankiales bacterium]|nr:hypothetical protein [Frankiales bacterium]
MSDVSIEAEQAPTFDWIDHPPKGRWLYRYIDAVGLEKTLKSGTLRFGSYTYLNDPRENHKCGS